MERSKGRSGEVLRLMTVFAVSIRTSVPWLIGTSWYQPSSSTTEWLGAKRLCGLCAVPRPFCGVGGNMVRPCTVFIYSTKKRASMPAPLVSTGSNQAMPAQERLVTHRAAQKCLHTFKQWPGSARLKQRHLQITPRCPV
ncbi:hypothetical protein D3C80_998080 [compost metagenome]